MQWPPCKAWPSSVARRTLPHRCRRPSRGRRPAALLRSRSRGTRTSRTMQPMRQPGARSLACLVRSGPWRAARMAASGRRRLRSAGRLLPRSGFHSRPATVEGGSPRPASILDAMPPASPDARSAAASHETALPTPQSLPSPVQQIADRLVADIASSGEARPADGTAAMPAAATAQPLKVLTVQLNPAELGVVTVRIALKSDGLELQIETDRRETARLVDADRETLSRVLRSAGYNVETVTVRAVDPANAPAAVGSQHASARRLAAAVASRRLAVRCQAVGRARARRARRQPSSPKSGRQG